MKKNKSDSKYPYEGEVAVSYARASTLKQPESIGRQDKRSIDYINRNKMVLDDSVHFADEGVSAWHGKNYRGEGNLAKFTDLVKAGAYPNGVHLVVEALDRMYRDDVTTAQGHFNGMLKLGVTIHTLNDKQVNRYIRLVSPGERWRQMVTCPREFCSGHPWARQFKDGNAHRE